jgi:hypothetical protein
VRALPETPGGGLMGSQLPTVPDRDVVVHEFENGRQWIRCRLNQFRGKVFCDIRVFYEPDPGAPMRPTPKGISILAENLDELEAAVAAFKEALKSGGRVRRIARRADIDGTEGDAA